MVCPFFVVMKTAACCALSRRHATAPELCTKQLKHSALSIAQGISAGKNLAGQGFGFYHHHIFWCGQCRSPDFLMKKLSAVQLKQQKAVLSAVEALEQQATLELPGFIQGWFSLEYEAFPVSLLVRLQFVSDEALTAAQPHLLVWQKRLSGLMLKKGVILKDMRKHLVFTCMGPED